MKNLHDDENYDDPNDSEDENLPTTIQVSDSQHEGLNITAEEQ